MVEPETEPKQFGPRGLILNHYTIYCQGNRAIKIFGYGARQKRRAEVVAATTKATFFFYHMKPKRKSWGEGEKPKVEGI